MSGGRNRGRGRGGDRGYEKKNTIDPAMLGLGSPGLLGTLPMVPTNTGGAVDTNTLLQLSQLGGLGQSQTVELSGAQMLQVRNAMQLYQQQQAQSAQQTHTKSIEAMVSQALKDAGISKGKGSAGGLKPTKNTQYSSLLGLDDDTEPVTVNGSPVKSEQSSKSQGQRKRAKQLKKEEALKSQLTESQQYAKELEAQLSYLEDEDNLKGYLSDGGRPTRQSTAKWRTFLKDAKEHSKLDSPEKNVKAVAREVVKQLGAAGCQRTKGKHKRVDEEEEQDETVADSETAVSNASEVSGLSKLIKKAKAAGLTYRAKGAQLPPKKLASNLIKAFDKLLGLSEIDNVPKMGQAYSKMLDITADDAARFLEKGEKNAETQLVEGVGNKYGIPKKRQQSLKQYCKHLIWILVCSEQDITVEPLVAGHWTLS